MPQSPQTASFLPRGDALPGGRVVRGGDLPERWWELFRSRALTSLVDEAIENNPDLRAAEAAVRVAQANALAQRGALFPALGGNFGANRQLVPGSTLSSGAASGDNLYSVHTAQLSVAFAPDIFGGTRRLVEAADAQVKFQAFQREGIYLTLAANVALAAIQEASLREQLAVTNRMVTLQGQLFDILKRQSDAGQIGQNDVIAQETVTAQSRLLLAPLQRQLEQQRNLLAVLTGRLPSDAPRETFQLTSFRLPRTVPLTLPANLIRQRPDIRAAEAALEASNAQIGAAIANRLPAISLTANAGSSATALSQLFTPGAGFWFVGANVMQTVFDAGTLANRQVAAEETFAQSAQLYRKAVLVAFQNVADALRALQSDARMVRDAANAERAASRGIDLVRRQVESGQVSIGLLLASQQAYLQTSLARVQAEAAQLADMIALFQALGGGWWNRPAVTDPAGNANL